MDTTEMRLRSVRKRVADIIQATKSDRQLQIIATLTVVLIILVVTAFL